SADVRRLLRRQHRRLSLRNTTLVHQGSDDAFTARIAGLLDLRRRRAPRVARTTVVASATRLLPRIVVRRGAAAGFGIVQRSAEGGGAAENPHDRRNCKLFADGHRFSSLSMVARDI